ncbi:glycosyltransferase [Sphingomonas aurantiaca]|uniref:glycosyltransferase n=1 Tax=Sphingomonas aurantiaca TaxID=185949 RepID=UPI002FE30F2C
MAAAPAPVPGVRVVGLEALGEQDGGDFERDIDAMVEAIARDHAAHPFDLLHAQYGYPTGWATMIAAQRLGLPASCRSRAVTGIGSARAARRTGSRWCACSTMPARC